MNSLKGMMSAGIWNGLMAYIVLKRLKIMHIVITTKNQIIHNEMSIKLHIMFFSNCFELIGLAVAAGLSPLQSLRKATACRVTGKLIRKP